MAKNIYHVPVLLKEVIEGLNIKAGGKYIDATVGGGGHTRAILEKGGKVLAIDQDPESIKHIKLILSKNIEDGSLLVAEENFDKLLEIAQKYNWECANGILFDLGVSSHQLENSSRGFSFQNNGPLDMRMNPNLGVTAADLINALSEKELADIFFRLGGEKKGRLIARAIVQARKEKKIETTRQLAQLVERVSLRTGKLHPATKVFQALRIVTNSELESLEKALPQTLNLLSTGGRLAAISFHEGEDRIVKNFMKKNQVLKMLTKKPITANIEEIVANPRSRSAKLRIAEKI